MISLAFFLLLGAGNIRAQTEPLFTPEYAVPDSGEIVAVQFVGDSALLPEELQSVITTHYASWTDRAEYILTFGALGSRVQFTDQYTREHDVNALLLYYRDNGFMNARITSELRADSAAIRQVEKITKQNLFEPRALRRPVPILKDTVLFRIVEGPPTVITGVTYEGLENLPEELQPELEEHSLLKRNTRYAAKDVRAEHDRLSTILGENGYPFFRIDSTVAESANPGNTKVHVEFYAHTGNRYRLGAVKIVYDTVAKTTSTVSKSAVLSELDLDSGAWFKGSVLSLGEQNLNKLQTFENVHISLDTTVLAGIPDSERHGTALPVIVELRMKPTQNISLGAFGGSGALGFSLGAIAGYTNHNIFGGAQLLDVEATYQFLPTTQKYYLGSINLTFPFRHLPFLKWLFPLVTNAPLTIGTGFSRAEQVGRYAERLFNAHTALNITIGDPSNRTSVTPDLIAELVYRQYFDPQLLAYYQTSQRQQINAIASVSGQWDRTNDFANPTKGFFTGGEVALGTPLLRFLAPTYGSASYFKWLVHLKDFEPLARDGRLTVGARLRVADEILFNPGVPPPQLSDIPIERRLFVGGGSSVRGWPSQALLVAPTADSLRLTTEGGYQSLEFNFEMRWSPYSSPPGTVASQKLLSPLQFAFFFDAGQAWDAGVQSKTLSQLALTVGTGIRYLTFLGPIRVDFGIKLYDPNPQWGTYNYASNEKKIYDATGVLLPNNYPANPGTQGVWITQRRFDFNAWSISFNLGQAF